VPALPLVKLDDCLGC